MFEWVGTVFSEVGTWFVTGQEQQQFDLQGQSLTIAETQANTDYLIAQDGATFDANDQTELLTYAGIAVAVIIIIAIIILIVRK